LLRIAGALVCALTWVQTPVAADELRATLSQPLREVSHEVEVRLDRGVAVYRVRRSFANNGKRADEASLSIDLPHGAAVTGLRIRARDRWYDAELMEAKAAAEKYHELTSMGAWQPKDPALMQWVWPDRVHLQVFPVLPGAASTVEYTLSAPLYYRDGRYVLSYPRFTGNPDAASAASGGRLALAQPVLQVQPGHGDATTLVRVDGQQVPPGMPVVLEPPAELPWIGEGAADSSASYIWSPLLVAETGPVVRATVELVIDHTYRSDLSAALVTPTGQHLALELPGGSDNDVRGSFEVALPAGTQAEGSWYLMVSDQVGLDVGTLESWSLMLADADAAPGQKAGKSAGQTASARKVGARHRKQQADGLPMFIPDAPQDEGEQGLAMIEIAAPPIDTAEARFGRVVVSRDRAFVRLEVEAAPELGTIPRQARIVFVLDGSRSVMDMEPQLQLVRAYLIHVPDAHVDLVIFRRHAERVFGAFVPATEFETRLAAAAEDGKLSLHNGSALEAGLERAAEALRGQAGEKRIVLTTDALVRSRFRNADAIRALARAPKGTIAHIALPEHGNLELARDDDHVLADIPESTGGVLFRVTSEGGDSLKERAAAILGMVRPISIDHFTVEGMTLDDSHQPPESLHEGKSYRFMLSVDAAPTRLTIGGLVWNRRYRRVVADSPRFNRATAAFVFSEDEYQDLSEAEMMKVAMYGRAVSPVTSYLAVEPGVRPSVAGIPLEGRGTGMGFGSGFGTIGRGAGGGGSARRPFTIRELMDAGIRRCVSEHRPRDDWQVELDVETTWREVVDAQVVKGASAGKAFDQCLIEAAWTVDLTWNFNDQRRMYRVSLSG
jgi:subtilisin-like proprotein convertase family protein